MIVMEEVEILKALEAMEADPGMVTESAYRANAEQWPDHRISFKDTHLSYLKAHPNTDPSQYLSNLRMRMRLRP